MLYHFHRYMICDESTLNEQLHTYTVLYTGNASVLSTLHVSLQEPVLLTYLLHGVDSLRS